MPRNLDRRVETLIRVDNSKHKKYFDELLQSYENEEYVHWNMENSYNWTRKILNEEGKRLKDLHQEILEVTNGI
jgi:polyphosphate kinase